MLNTRESSEKFNRAGRTDCLVHALLNDAAPSVSLITTPSLPRTLLRPHPILKNWVILNRRSGIISQRLCKITSIVKSNTRILYHHCDFQTAFEIR